MNRPIIYNPDTNQITINFYVRFITLRKNPVDPVLRVAGFIETPDGSIERCTLFINDLKRIAYIRTLENIDPIIFEEQIKKHSNFDEICATGVVRRMGNIYNSNKDLVFKIKYEARDTFNCDLSELEFSSFQHGTTLNPKDIFCLEKGLRGPMWMLLDLHVDYGGPNLVTFGKEYTIPSKSLRNPKCVSRPSAIPAMTICSLEVFFHTLEGGHIAPYIIVMTSSELNLGVQTMSNEFIVFLNIPTTDENIEEGIQDYADAMNYLYSMQGNIHVKITTCTSFMLKRVRNYIGELLPDILVGDHKLVQLCQDVERINEQFVLQELLKNSPLINIERAAHDLYGIEAFDKRSLYINYLPKRDTESFINDYSAVIPRRLRLTENPAAEKRFIDVILASAAAQLKLLDKLRILDSYTELASMTGCPLNDVFTSMRMQRAEHLLKFHLYQENIIIPETIDPARPNIVQVQGGRVIKPKDEHYGSYVFAFDFKSLYPSIICEKNVGSWMKLRNLFHRLMVERKRLADTENRTQKVHCSTVFKQLANITIGLFSSTISAFYCPDLLSAVTALGRRILSDTIKTTRVGKVIYAHTDSVFVHVSWEQLGSYQRAVEYAQEYVTTVNRKFRNVKIKLEGIFSNTFICSATEYVMCYHSEFYSSILNSSGQWIVKGVLKKTLPPILEQALVSYLAAAVERNRFPDVLCSDDVYDYVIALPIRRESVNTDRAAIRFTRQHAGNVPPCLQTVYFNSNHDIARQYTKDPVTVDEFRIFKEIFNDVKIDKQAYFEKFLKAKIIRLLQLKFAEFSFDVVPYKTGLRERSNIGIPEDLVPSDSDYLWEYVQVKLLELDCTKCGAKLKALWKLLRTCSNCQQQIDENILIEQIYASANESIKDYLAKSSTVSEGDVIHGFFHHRMQLLYLEQICKDNGLLDIADQMQRNLQQFCNNT